MSSLGRSRALSRCRKPPSRTVQCFHSGRKSLRTQPSVIHIYSWAAVSNHAKQCLYVQGGTDLNAYFLSEPRSCAGTVVAIVRVSLHTFILHLSFITGGIKHRIVGASLCQKHHSHFPSITRERPVVRNDCSDCRL